MNNGSLFSINLQFEMNSKQQNNKKTTSKNIVNNVKAVKTHVVPLPFNLERSTNSEN